MNKTAATLVLALGALTLTACGGMGGSNSLSEGQAQAIGDSIANELESSTTSLTATDLVGQGVASASLASVSSQSAMVPPACVTFSPNPLVDSDADGVPNGASYTFNCSKTRVSGGTTTVTGQAQLSDPGVGFNLTLTNLKTEVKNSDGSLSYSATRNGTRNATGSASQITLAHDLAVSRLVTGLPSSSITNKFNLVFNAAAGTIIAQGQALPSGSATVAGSYSWVRGSESFSFNISTPTALSYDSSCTSDLKIVGGVLRATLAGMGNDGFIRITFNACGVKPTVVFLASNI